MTAVMILTRRAAPALVALAALALTFPLGAAAAPPPSPWGDPLPPQEAAPLVAAAQEAAAALGLPFGPDVRVREYVSPDGRPEWDVDSGRWTYTHGGDSPVIVDPETGGQVRGARGPMRLRSSFSLARPGGELLGAVDYAAAKLPPGVDLEEQPPLLSEAEAIARATAALEAVGMPRDIVLYGASLEGPSSPDSVREWVVTWQYVYRGFRYEGGNPRVMLDAHTGAVSGFMRHPRPPAPPQTVVAVREERAVGIALARLAALGWAARAPRPLTTAWLEIAQRHPPPGPYDPEGPLPPLARYDDPAYLVWRVEVGTEPDPVAAAQGGRAAEPEPVAYIQVDAATGAVVGEAQAGGRLPRPASSAPAASRAPARRSSALPLLVGGLLMAGVVAGGLFVRARRARP